MTVEKSFFLQVFDFRKSIFIFKVQVESDIKPFHHKVRYYVIPARKILEGCHLVRNSCWNLSNILDSWRICTLTIKNRLTELYLQHMKNKHLKSEFKIRHSNSNWSCSRVIQLTFRYVYFYGNLLEGQFDRHFDLL